LVVTKKIGDAVTRNRIKRVCREAFRTWKDLVPEGVDLVVIAREGAGALGLAEVREEWQRVERQLRRRVQEAAEDALALREKGAMPVARGPGKPHVPARAPKPGEAAAAASPARGGRPGATRTSKK
jgi:ribonuclease P protein component